MNDVMDLIRKRKSVRKFKDIPISSEIKNELFESAFQAPTAGNQMLYTILDISDQDLKEKLSVSCDNQPFIAEAPLVLVFLADCRQWHDAYLLAGASPRNPGLGDILLACQDTVIAAQNMVIAAESFGLGSCYIGDILENKESVTEMLHLDKWTLPISMLVLGYPTDQQQNRTKPERFASRFMVRENVYSRLSDEEIREKHGEQSGNPDFDFDSSVKAFCERKYMSGFSKEMNRTAALYLKEFEGTN